MVSFNTQAIRYLVIPSGATTGARIVIDGTNGFILVYDASNHLIGSIAAADGTDGLGNTVDRGLTDYDSTVAKIAAQLDNGSLRFNPIGNPSQFLASITGTNVLGSDSTSPLLQLNSPDASPAGTNFVQIQMYGQSKDGTGLAHILFTGATGAQLDMQVNGVARYANETWHVPTLNANWSNTAGLPVLQYKRDANGRVWFAGVTQWNAAGVNAPQVIFTLPAAYAPTATRCLTARTKVADNVATQAISIQVNTNGDVVATNWPVGTGPITPIAFDGLSFDLFNT